MADVKHGSNVREQEWGRRILWRKIPAHWTQAWIGGESDILLSRPFFTEVVYQRNVFAVNLASLIYNIPQVAECTMARPQLKNREQNCACTAAQLMKTKPSMKKLPKRQLRERS